MAGLQYNFFPTDLLYPKPSQSSSSSSSEAMNNKTSVSFRTHHPRGKGEDGAEPKSLIIQKADVEAANRPLVLKQQTKLLPQLSRDSTQK